MNLRYDSTLQFLRDNGDASVQELADHFEVSVMTIRRDLAALEQSGKLKRTHGGAVLSKEGIVEFTFERKGKKFSTEKRAIAQEVAKLIHPGMSISLDSGTTTLEVAKAIAGIESLTVLTSSLAIASVLYAHENIELVLLGGRARKGNPDLTGWLTEENSKRFHVDMTIIGADGINQTGAFTTAVDITKVCQALIEGGEKGILVADHTKFDKPSFAKFASLKDFDHIITDEGMRSATRKWLSKHANKITYSKIAKDNSKSK
jgi:DeoR family transcriptional regulator, fructose operon transcriptional repressor